MRSTSLIFIALAAACLADGQINPAASQPERPPITGVAHIGLYVSDVAKADEFYGHVLGFAHFSLDKPTGGLMLNYYKVNDHQYIEVYPNLKSPTADRLSHIAFETADAHKLRDYLAAKGVKVPATLKPGLDKNYSFMIKDAEGHDVEFVEYVPGGLHASKYGTLLPDARVSDHMIHVGFTIADRDAADRLYRDILGFKLMWYGGMNDTETRWVDMRVPDGTDWLEYMLHVQNPTPKTLGVNNHLALGVKSIQPAYQTVLSHGYKPDQPPKIGRDGKWQLNLYDPDLTRAELMEFKPTQTPCCSPMILPTP
jgi:catechol 2,3-dioxygenase-like lactoylglutathione lyase family enzyme